MVELVMLTEDFDAISYSPAFYHKYKLQYSIYAGRHDVPGLEGLLIKCTADVKCAWIPLSMPTWSQAAQVPCQYD